MVKKETLFTLAYRLADSRKSSNLIKNSNDIILKSD